MFDAHRHGPCSSVNALPPRWGALLASSGPTQWAQIADTTSLPNVRYFYGLLPQEFQSPDHAGGDPELIVQDLENLLMTHREAGMGEIGIDERFCQTVPMESQLILAERLIGIAQRLDRPVVLHVVRADGIMLNLLKKIKPQIPLLWHGFLGSMETARELAALGCTISIAPSIWRVGTKLQDRLSSLRMPVLLETDYPYHYRLPGGTLSTYAAVLDHHYHRFAQATGISLEALEHKCDGYAQVFTNQ
ncbi:MAG: hypothetical protein CVV52_06155 [Spirochaetae bacterium HGW-Spirochaetae-8]|nr:MAG: hypothetical protein CVV52_06155 [Spirochaetae bacterium HGW-Spirochaetae-8]